MLKEHYATNLPYLVLSTNLHDSPAYQHIIFITEMIKCASFSDGLHFKHLSTNIRVLQGFNILYKTSYFQQYILL